MLTLIDAAAGALALASLPYWLPGLVVRLRTWIFTRINGAEGIAIPGEHYEDLAATTRRMLALPRGAAEALAQHCVERVLDDDATRRTQLVRLRDFAMPIWADFYHEVVFDERCPPQARRLIVDNAYDVVAALQCSGLRHMRKRTRLTEFLVAKIERGELPHTLPARLSTREKALYLQGVIFDTAIVRMSEATAHLLLALAQHPDVQATVVQEAHDGGYLDRVISETLRVALDEHMTIGKCSVACFSHPNHHRAGHAETARFDPTLRVVVREVLQRYSLHSSASHVRSLPNGGPCVLTPRGRELHWGLRAVVGVLMRTRDRWEDVVRSLVQLVLGTYVVWDARRLRMCTRHFERVDGDSRAAEKGRPPHACPIDAHVPHRQVPQAQDTQPHVKEWIA